MPIFQLTESLYVAAQIARQDIPDLATRGFTVVVCNRPDGEVPGQATMDEIEAACNAAGLLFVRYPVDAMNFLARTLRAWEPCLMTPINLCWPIAERAPDAPTCGSPHRPVMDMWRRFGQPGILVSI